MLHSKLVSSSVNMIRIVASCSRRQMVGTAQRKIQNRMKLGGGGRKRENDFHRLFPSPFLFFRFFRPPLSISSHSPTYWTPETDYHNNRDQFNLNYFFEIPGSLLVGSFWSLMCWNSLPFLSHKPGPTNPHPSPRLSWRAKGQEIKFIPQFSQIHFWKYYMPSLSVYD